MQPLKSPQNLSHFPPSFSPKKIREHNFKTRLRILTWYSEPIDTESMHRTIPNTKLNSQLCFNVALIDLLVNITRSTTFTFTYTLQKYPHNSHTRSMSSHYHHNYPHHMIYFKTRLRIQHVFRADRYWIHASHDSKHTIRFSVILIALLVITRSTYPFTYTLRKYPHDSHTRSISSQYQLIISSQLSP